MRSRWPCREIRASADGHRGLPGASSAGTKRTTFVLPAANPAEGSSGRHDGRFMMTTAIAPTLDLVAIDDLAGKLRGEVIRPGDAAYDEARGVWNGMIDRRPALIARCRGVADVVACVRFAAAHGTLLAVRGGGHNVAGFGTCDGGLVIDLSAMRGVRVDS